MTTTGTASHKQAVAQPPYPLYALTTYELARYRRALEHVIAHLDALDPPDRAVLRARLDEVSAEQDQRTQIRHPGRGTR